MNQSNLIIKNTLFLYLRAILSLGLKLYTARLILAALGVEEFGVYQVVGGIVAMFSFLNSSMTQTSLRFIAYEVGTDNKENIRKVFSMAINVHILIAIIVFIAIEVAGVYLLNGHLNLGKVDISTAQWILLFTALATVFTITSVPYNSFIIAKEDMKYFAYTDIFGEVFKLGVGLSLSLFVANRLIYYSILMLVVAVIIRLVYMIICHVMYKEAHYIFIWDKGLLFKMANFSAWATLSSISYMVKQQGITFIVNYFFGPILNAAVGVANQVNNAVKTFSVNTLTSFSSQIIKTYAAKDYVREAYLVQSGAKIATYLMIIFSVPLMLEIDYILGIWLVNVPSYTAPIVCLILLETIISTMTSTGNVAVRATGKIRNYEILTNTIELLALPAMIISILVYHKYYIPFIMVIVFECFSYILKLRYIKKFVPEFKLNSFVLEIFIMCPIITVIAIVIPLIIKLNMGVGLLRFLVLTIVFEVILLPIVYLFGLNQKERLFVHVTTLKLLKKIHL